MIGRIILTVLVLVFGFFVLSQLEQRFTSERQADMAIEQVETNSGAEMIAEQRAQNWIEPITYLCMIGLVIWIWIKPVKKWYKAIPSSPPNIGDNG